MAGIPPVPGSEQRPSQRAGDALAGPADYSRPANPWPRLIAFGLVVLGVLFLSGLCLASFANTPDREIRVRLSEFTPGTPKFLAIPSFGHDAGNNTFGAFLAVTEDQTRAVALFSRSHDSGCNLRWDPAAGVGDVRGLYVDPCSPARYTFDGVAVHEGATRDLHRFGVVREVTGYVVNFEELTLGACRADLSVGCSPDGAPVLREVPKNVLPPEFGNE